jgi:hypothetical protein
MMIGVLRGNLTQGGVRRYAGSFCFVLFALGARATATRPVASNASKNRQSRKTIGERVLLSVLDVSLEKLFLRVVPQDTAAGTAAATTARL